MTSWIPEWRISVGDDVYTTVTAASLTTGRTDIDRQPNAGYSKVEIINTTGVDFTIDVGDSVLLELKNSTGTYVPVFGGAVTDFNIGVRSPQTGGYITTGTILSAGNLTRLAKYVYTAALAEGLDGAQIATILGAALNLSWAEVTPTLTWASYPPLVTWDTAESYVGTVDSGVYTMIATTAGTPKAETLADQIATSALGQLYEDKSTGNVNYDDADHRTIYLNTYGYTSIDAAYATPSSIKSNTQSAKIRNSLIYKYDTAYGSTYSTSDADSVATYGRFEYRVESNIKNLANITALGSRELALRAVPYAQFQAVTFRLDNSNMPSATRDNIINAFFGQPIEITNLPSNMFGGTFQGFLEGYSINSTATYVDVTLNLSPAKFSLPTVYDNYALAQTITNAGNTTFTVPAGVSQIAVFLKGYGGNGGNGNGGSSGNGGAGGSGGGGAGAGAFWNYDVVAGQTYTVSLDFTGTKLVSFGSLMSVSSGANGTTAGGSASSGGLYSRDAGVVYYTSQTGTPSGAAGAARSGSGNGNSAQNGFGAGSTLTVPTNIGLPANFTAGSGGGGGGGGAVKTSGFNFFDGGSGGTASSGGAQGGNGGNAYDDANGQYGFSSTGTGNGGGGGGGGAFSNSLGSGSGGLGSTGSGAIVYIYKR